MFCISRNFRIYSGESHGESQEMWVSRNASNAEVNGCSPGGHGGRGLSEMKGGDSLWWLMKKGVIHLLCIFLFTLLQFINTHFRFLQMKSSIGIYSRTLICWHFGAIAAAILQKSYSCLSSADLHGMNFSLAHSESWPHVPTHTCACSALIHSPNSRGARCSNGRQMYSSAACWVLTLPLASCSEIFLTGSTDACCFSFLFMHTNRAHSF